MAPERRGKTFSYALRLRTAQRPAPGAEPARRVFFLCLGGCWGEACPGHGETAAETGQILNAILGDLARHAPGPPPGPQAFSDRLRERYPMAPAARAAAEVACAAAAAQAAALPLHAFLRLPPPEGLPTSFVLRLEPEEELEARLDEARDFSCLKVRCSGPAGRDLALLRWLARHTDQPLRIDAAGGWTQDEALRILPELGRLRVEYLEQPLARHLARETAQLMRLSPVPILLAEDVGGAGGVEHIAGCCNGFVVKLMTSGGLAEALRRIRQGRRLGLRIALDSGLESSVAVTAAAHLAGAADYVDLSAPLLLENDPFAGLAYDRGKITLPPGPGTGIRLREAYRDAFRLPAP